MSSGKSSKQEKIKQEAKQDQEEVTRPDKKSKAKKKKKEPSLVSEKKSHKQPKPSSSSRQPKAKLQPQPPVKQQPPRPAPDPIGQQLSSLYYDGLLSPNHFTCQTINSHLQQVTINLYQSMIMRASLIHKAITIARQSHLTPKEYFFLDYTNKLLLIKKLLIMTAANKYSEFIVKIDQQVKRVTALVERSIEEVAVHHQVLRDLLRCNVEWTLNEGGEME